MRDWHHYGTGGEWAADTLCAFLLILAIILAFFALGVWIDTPDDKRPHITITMPRFSR